MIVVLSQDKRVIIKCRDICANDNDVVEYTNESTRTCVMLGTYATEERAKEVVAEIWSIMMKCFVANLEPYFTMPTE